MDYTAAPVKVTETQQLTVFQSVYFCTKDGFLRIMTLLCDDLPVPLCFLFKDTSAVAAACRTEAKKRPKGKE